METQKNFTTVAEHIFPGPAEPVRAESVDWRLRLPWLRSRACTKNARVHDYLPYVTCFGDCDFSAVCTPNVQRAMCGAGPGIQKAPCGCSEHFRGCCEISFCLYWYRCIWNLRSAERNKQKNKTISTDNRKKITGST